MFVWCHTGSTWLYFAPNYCVVTCSIPNLIIRGTSRFPHHALSAGSNLLQVVISMETSEGQVEKKKSDVSCDVSAGAHHSPKKKHKRKHSGDGDHAKHHVHGGKHSHRPPHKRFKHSFGMSSTKLANNIMRFRLGGSVSDPLNLEGETLANLDDDCSTCAPSPAGGPEVFGQPSPLPFHLQHDPLNLEGKSKDFPANKMNKHVHHGLHQHNKHGRAGHKKKQGRRRTISKTEDHEKQEVGVASDEKTAAAEKVRCARQKYYALRFVFFLTYSLICLHSTQRQQSFAMVTMTVTMDTVIAVPVLRMSVCPC